MFNFFYSNLIPNRLSKKCFECNFKEELSLSLNTDTLLSYVNKINIDFLEAKDIIRKTLIDGELTIYPSPIRVYIPPQMDSLQRRFIDDVLEGMTTENISFNFTTKIDGYHGLHFNSIQPKTDSKDIQWTYFTRSRLNAYRFRDEINIFCDINKEFSNGQKRKIANTILQCIGPRDSTIKVLDDNFHVTYNVKEIISLIYSGIIPIGTIERELNQVNY